MTWAPLLACLFLLAAALAGCSGPGEGGAGEPCDQEPVLCDPDSYFRDHYCVVNDVRPRVWAPDTPGPDSEADPWRQGDYWSYRLRVDGQGRGTTTLVYYDDADVVQGEAQHYLVGTSPRAEALEHALFSVNPLLGRIHRTLYSPHESGDHADMFNFPLCEGNSWTSRFYGTDFRFTAHQAAVALPGGSPDPLGFRIDGVADDGSEVTVAYSPQAHWFTLIDLQKADGTGVRLELTAFGSGRTGRYEFLRAQQDEAIDLGLQTAASIPVEREDGREGPYDNVGVYLELERTAGQGRVEVHLRDPAGTSRACVGVAGSGLGGQPTACPAGPLQAEAPYQAGTWSVTIDKVDPLGQVEIEGEARIVSLYDRGGTV